MSTVSDRSTSRKPRTIKPAHGTCSLTLTINGTPYRVRPLSPHPEVATFAVALVKPDEATYHVSVREHGAECDCPDWTYNRAGKDPRGCKHICALRAWGLLPEASPRRSTGDLAANDPAAYEQLQEEWTDYPAPEPWTDADYAQFAQAYGQDGNGD